MKKMLMARLTCSVMLFGMAGMANAEGVVATGPLPTLTPGWNLVGLTSTEPYDVTQLEGVTSVWKWTPVNGSKNWSVYIPGEVFQGEYAAAKGYGLLTTIEFGDGFWVNVPAPAETTTTTVTTTTTTTTSTTSSTTTTTLPSVLSVNWLQGKTLYMVDFGGSQDGTPYEVPVVGKYIFSDNGTVAYTGLMHSNLNITGTYQVDSMPIRLAQVASNSARSVPDFVLPNTLQMVEAGRVIGEEMLKLRPQRDNLWQPDRHG
jgi:hypothetical protein